MRFRSRFSSGFDVAYLDTAWFLCLAVYLFAGIPHISFHPDETSHIYMSGDYSIIFIEHSVEQVVNILDENGRLRSNRAKLRLIDAPLDNYVFGLAWHMAGMTADDLPENWDWRLDWLGIPERSTVPSDQLLYTVRFASAMLLFASVVVMFALGWLYGKRPFAFFASGLYALNPLPLFHARRAMHEAPLLLFGLLAILAAALISRKRERGEPISLRWWLTLGLMCGLCVASKHNGVVYIGAALAWLFVSELARRDWRGALSITPQLIGVGVVSLVVFVALTPALWVDTFSRLKLLTLERGSIVRTQAHTMNYQPAIQERFEHALTAAFIAPVDVEINTRRSAVRGMSIQYRDSALSGIPFGSIIGGILTIAAFIGAAACVWKRLRPPSYSAALCIGLAIFALAFAVSLVLSPLPWQRYFIVAVPPMTLLASVGLHTLIYHAQSALNASRVSRG